MPGLGWGFQAVETANQAFGDRLLPNAKRNTVPNQTLSRRVIRRLGQCSYDERGATVAVAPSPLVTAAGHDGGSRPATGLEWPVAHPVVIALDLAQDLARGREILDEWTPQGFHRVW